MYIYTILRIMAISIFLTIFVAAGTGLALLSLQIQSAAFGPGRSKSKHGRCSEIKEIAFGILN
jgi:hypothetical protein